MNDTSIMSITMKKIIKITMENTIKSGLLLSVLFLLLSLISCGQSDQLSTQQPGQNTSKSQQDKQTILQTSNLYGIDISHYQGNLVDEIDSNSPLTFIICKATEGLDYVDPKFSQNWHAVKAKGFIRGAYHFYVVGDDPTIQANHFAEIIQGLDKGDIAPIVDIEQASIRSRADSSNKGSKNKGSNNSDTSNSAEAIQRQLQIFLKVLENRLERRPLIYTSYNFAQKYLNTSDLTKYDLWLAEYSGGKQPRLPDPWQTKGYKIWQKSDTYQIDSVNTDFDVHVGSRQTLID